MENKDFFNENKYCLVESVLPKDILDIITMYTLFDELNNFSPEGFGTQVPRAHSKYADPLMESLLIALLPTLEKNTGLSLYPTYSYYRVYRNGDDLKPHIDRESCEISTTLCLGYNYNDKNGTWPIFIDGRPFSLYAGDMAIYRGMELNHYREPFMADENAYHVQCFLHYVDQNGPFSEFKFDKRSQIGIRH